VLFCDEAHIGTDTEPGYGWAKADRPLVVNSHSPPLGQKRTCFGAYAYGQSTAIRIEIFAWANAESTCAFLKTLRSTYPDRRLVVVWDNVSYHHAKMVAACAATLGIELVFLPPYSPGLQPVERLWAWLREELQALHCHRDLAELEARIACFEATLNDCPSAVHARLRPKLHLDPAKEKLRL